MKRKHPRIQASNVITSGGGSSCRLHWAKIIGNAVLQAWCHEGVNGLSIMTTSVFLGRLAFSDVTMCVQTTARSELRSRTYR